MPEKHRTDFLRECATGFGSSTVERGRQWGGKDTVSKQSQHDEVDGGPHPVLHAPLGSDPVVHHLVPVLARQDLEPFRQTPHRYFNRFYI